MSDTENHEIGALRAQLTETLIFNDQVNAFEQIFVLYQHLLNISSLQCYNSLHS
jgi:hypothetical protein